MAEIKSSLEIAMERTAGVKADKNSIRTHEIKREGQKLASLVLSGQEKEPVKKLKSYSGGELEAMKEGFTQTLLANLSLPSDESALERLEHIRDGFAAVLRDKNQSAYIHQHLQKFFSQYLSDRKRLEEALKNQLAGKIKAKEEQLTRQTGTPMKLNINADPDFLKALRQNMIQLDGQYGEALDQLKEQLREMITKG